MTESTPSIQLDQPLPPRPTKRSLSMSTTTSIPLLKTTTQPKLNELKLADILNGETCPPISFQDFASFIANKEFSTENLLFIIWFRSYNARYQELPEATRIRIPVPSTRLGDRYRPFEYLNQVQPDQPTSIPAKREEVKFLSSGQSVGLSADAKLRSEFKVCGWTEDGKPCDCGKKHEDHQGRGHAGSSKFPFRLEKPSGSRGSSSPSPSNAPTPIIHSSMHPNSPPAGTVFLEPSEQPLREEAARAFATFLKKEGSKELGISDDLREYARSCLQRSTAPEVFQPIYEEVYQVVETQSLPHFLTYAKGNINRPKRIFWYFVGTVDVLIGVIIFLILTLLLSPHKYPYRLTRLPSLVFIFFGCAQFYSAYRNFCNQIWGRQSMQMRPWEMDDADEESLLGATQSQQQHIGTSKAEEEDGLVTTGEIPFTSPVARGVDPTLPKEAKDMVKKGVLGCVPPVFEKDTWGTKVDETLGPNESSRHEGLDTGPIQEGEEMSEVQQRQLALRRATVKIPDASLAFPINESANRKSDISPFDFDPGFQPQQGESGTAGTTGERGQYSDLTNILNDYDLTKPRSPTPKDKKRVKVFGPETVVHDPRIKALYKSIVRDIIIVASFFSIIWLALILAVPMRGLA